VIAAIAVGDEPPFGDDAAGRAVHAVARRLAETGRLDDATHAAARDALGDRGLVEIVTLCGYYTLVSFTLNAFEVPLPPRAEPTFS
jgi:4-carboxymuconolactone decarboxylase